MSGLNNLTKIKEEVSIFEKDFSARNSNYKANYFKRYHCELAEFYQNENYPDNYELRYSVDIFSVEDEIYYFCMTYHLGDFNLGFGYQDNYPYERHIDKVTADYLYKRFVNMGLWNSLEPLRIEALSDKLFPMEKRSRILNYFNDEESKE